MNPTRAAGAALILSSCLAACAPSVAVKHWPEPGKPTRVAILPFTDAPGAPGSGAAASSAFGAAFLSAPSYEVVEAGEVRRALAARPPAGGAPVDESRAVEVAKAVGADAAVIGEVAEFRERRALVLPAAVAMTVRLVDAKTGLVSWTASQRAGGYKRLLTWIVWPVGVIATATSPTGADQLQWTAKSIVKGLAQAAPKEAVSAAAPAAAPAPAGPGAAPDADLPNYKSRERPDDFAVVVGVEKYAQLPPARFAARDAAAVKAHLLALGVPERNIAFMTDSAAGRSSIEKYLEHWLPRLVRDDSRVYFYYSGHGAPDLKTGGAYLVPWDGDADYLESTGYPVKRLYAKLADLKAKEVFVAMDACFSGAGGRSVLPSGARPLVTKTDAVRLDPRIAALTASSGGQISGTDDAAGHGIFTEYLLAGLNGGAKDRTVRGLYDYLKPRVEDSARRLNRDQTPELLGGDAGMRLR